MNYITLSGFINNTETAFLIWSVLSIFYFFSITDDSFNATFMNIIFLFY